MNTIIGSMQVADSITGELSTGDVITGVIAPNKNVIKGELMPTETDSDDDI